MIETPDEVKAYPDLDSDSSANEHNWHQFTFHGT